MSKVNKYGLTRSIPESVKRQVRINSKFACIVPDCRESIYEYEHLIPEYKDAKEHNSDNICLTCAKHNPTKKGVIGNEYYSKQQLINFYKLIKNSKNPPPPLNKDFFNYLENPVRIKIGDFEMEDVESIITIDNENYLSFNKNKDNNEFAPKVMFSGKFNNSKKENIFTIKNNEWISDYNHYDLITTNGKIKIYEESRKCIFEAYKIPENNKIIISKLNLIKYPFNIFIEKDSFIVRRYINNYQWIEVKFKALISNQKIGISLNSSEKIDINKISFCLNCDGKMSNEIRGVGINLGIGGGTSRIALIRVELVDINKNFRFLLDEMDARKLSERQEYLKNINTNIS
jgi:hypothetical protein